MKLKINDYELYYIYIYSGKNSNMFNFEFKL